MTLSATRRRTGSSCSAIDHATTTLADLLQQFVAADGLAHGFVHRLVGEFELDRCLGGRRGGGPQVLRLIMGSEQGVEALAQGSVAALGAIQKTRALDAAKLGGGLKQSLFSGRFRFHVEIGRANLPQ
jgi:hypothetical protein